MLITATNDHKPSMTVTTPGAAALAPAAGALVVWVGTSAGPIVQARDGLLRCLEGLREAGTPGAAYGAKLRTGKGDAAKSNVTVAAGGPTVTNDDVGIAYGANFNVDGTTITPIVHRAMEMYLEQMKAE